MKKIRCIQNFTGVISLTKGETKTVKDEVADDLVNCDYAEIIDELKADPVEVTGNVETPTKKESSKKESKAEKAKDIKETPATGIGGTEEEKTETRKS